MTYDPKAMREKSWEREFPIFKKFQADITSEKLKPYRFDVTIQKSTERRLKHNHINCGVGFEHAHIEFKASPLATIYSRFNDSWKNPKIDYLWIRLNHDWGCTLQEINFSRKQRKMEVIIFNQDGHQTLQSCLDELEKLRKEISLHFTQK